ncbi:unnamed protein product [Ixodes hexagonus]
MQHVANSPDVTARFSRSVVRCILGNSLDGALFAGMFPTRAVMRNAMVRVVKKLSTLFRVHQLQLGVVVPPEADLFYTQNAGVKLAQFVDLVVVKVPKQPSWKAAGETPPPAWRAPSRCFGAPACPCPSSCSRSAWRPTSSGSPRTSRRPT